MRVRIKYIFILLLTIAVVSPRQAAAQAAPQATGVPPEAPLHADLAITYSYLHSNAPVGGCTCFNMNGFSVNSAWPLRPGGFAIASDLTFETIGNINSTNFSLSFGTLSVGTRYLFRTHHRSFQPYAEALVGGAHASGSLTRLPNPLNNNSTLAFAGTLGGGVDLRAGRTFAVRLVEADYLPTTFDNGVNNHQNNFRIASGLVIRF
jgi:peptidoglycan-associated lipoprotein